MIFKIKFDPFAGINVYYKQAHICQAHPEKLRIKRRVVEGLYANPKFVELIKVVELSGSRLAAKLDE